MLQESFLVEAKGNTLDAVKRFVSSYYVSDNSHCSILEVDANYFYIEYLRLMKDYEKIAKVSSGILRRLKQARSIFEIDAKDIKPDVLEFIDAAIKFYKAYGMWGLVHYNKKLLAIEDYSKKDYKRITLELVSMSEQMLNQIKELSTSKLDQHGYIYLIKRYAEFLQPTFEE